jgi:8-oxo-dGTP pyrophosphatase MutT (NUDIX family)
LTALDWALRIALTAVQQVRKTVWFFTRPLTFGAHAVALTPADKVVLVKLRYAPGWRIPGGGRRFDEDPVDAVLRELREEIGVLSHGEAKLAGEVSEEITFRHDDSSIVLVRDVRYRPRWTLEVESVREFPLDALPVSTAPSSRHWIEQLRPIL